MGRRLYTTIEPGHPVGREPQKPQLPLEIVAPLDVDRLAEVWRKFMEFKTRLLTKEDMVEIRGRQFLRKSAWRKWALACAVSDELLSYERVPAQGYDEKGGFLYRVIVQAIHRPSGRSSVGVAVVSKVERDQWAHEEHDVFALAHTRAKNRAIADLVGGGEVTAEEVIPGEVMEKSEVGKPSTVQTPSAATPPVSSVEKWQPRVQVTRDVHTVPGVRQFPLSQDTMAIGMMNVLEDGSEASLVPEKPVPLETGPVMGFLVNRVLEAMKAKHPGFDYHLDVDQNGLLQSVLIRGQLDESHIKELRNAAKWAFQHATEAQAQQSGSAEPRNS